MMFPFCIRLSWKMSHRLTRSKFRFAKDLEILVLLLSYMFQVRWKIVL